MSEHKAREAREARLTHEQAREIEERAMALAFGAMVMYPALRIQRPFDHQAAEDAVNAASRIVAESKRRAEIDVLAEAAE